MRVLPCNFFEHFLVPLNVNEPGIYPLCRVFVVSSFQFFSNRLFLSFSRFSFSLVWCYNLCLIPKIFPSIFAFLLICIYVNDVYVQNMKSYRISIPHSIYISFIYFYKIHLFALRKMNTVCSSMFNIFPLCFQFSQSL